jgi:UDP-N-acetyl-D-mannosaminuronate dehydrogenase
VALIIFNLSKKNKRILVIGLAYKEDINDCRESHSIKIIEKFIQKKLK